MTANQLGGTEPPRPGGPYSLARNAPWGEVYVSGQIGIDPTTGTLREGGIAPQTEQAINNVAAILASFGCSLSDSLKVSVFLADIDDFDAMNEVYSKRFTLPYPVRTTVQAGIARGARIEIDVIAQFRQTDQDRD